MQHKFYQFITILLISSIITNAFALVPARYVKPVATGTGDGSSWANASGNLQAMIQASSVGDEVWVAAGTYKPTNKPYDAGVEISTTDARDVTFHVKDGVKLYGGFAGIETTLSQRLITTNVTILSGDIGTVGVATDNAYHVVLTSAAASGGVGVTIDGFTITGGNANVLGSITVNSNAINRSYAGGVYTNFGTNTIINNTFSANSATGGGGICTAWSTNILSSNTLSGNSATNYGGGIYTINSTNTISNNTFSGNSSTNGGGIYTFNANTSIATTFSNNTLSSNMASNKGGGIYSEGGTCIHSNNTFSGNSSAYGGGIYISNGAYTISNNTFLGNSATTNGGGIFTFKVGIAATSNFSNNIFWGNKKGTDATVASADYYNQGVTVTFTNNLMQLASSTYTGTNYSLGASPTGNIFATDPLFVNAADIDGADNIHRTADDGLRLLPCSPAINVGTNTGVSATDIIGATRIQQSTVDIGAYENKDLAGYTLSASLLTANAECTDGAGITHYVNTANEALILSIQKNGNTIGTIGDGTFAVTAGGSGITDLGTLSSTPAPYASTDNWYTMNRYWKVTPTIQPTTDVNVLFYYRPEDFTDVQTASGIAAETDMVFYKINGTGNPDPTTAHAGTPTTPATAYNTAGYWQYTNGATASTTNWASGTYNGYNYAETIVAMFSGGGGGAGSGTGGGALPINLISFTGKPENKSNVLQWITSSELNNKGFNVQHSLNNKDFTTLGFLQGNGTTALQNNYGFTHNKPFAGNNYYRLQQVDNDGKITYSKVISINNKYGIITAQPNPSAGIFELQGLNTEEMQMRVLDITGKTVNAQIQGNKIDVSKQNIGIYYVQIVQNGQVVQTLKLVKV